MESTSCLPNDKGKVIYNSDEMCPFGKSWIKKFQHRMRLEIQQKIYHLRDEKYTNEPTTVSKSANLK